MQLLLSEHLVFFLSSNKYIITRMGNFGIESSSLAIGFHLFEMIKKIVSG